jgi:hypothetical protein
METCKRADGSILYTVDGKTLTVYNKKGNIIVESNGRRTTFYSSNGPWKIVEKFSSGYCLKKRCGSQWYAIDFDRKDDDDSFESSYSDLDGYLPLNWGGEDYTLLHEAKEAFNKASLISYGETPKEVWIRNNEKGVMELLYV